jgi:translation initiation factor IF-2
METRPPIVTILGHVDHGKTTLLDFIRKASVAAKEHGGITQHIGAYQVEHEGKLITFIDTPGHAAFEKMRSRGAKVADIAILVVALDDGLMPQTIEAIKHIQGAKVPMIVAINKIDLPGIDKTVQLQKIKKQLSDNGVNIEEYGGDVPLVEVSAKSGEGVDKLLEIITLVAEISELKGDAAAPTTGVVIESNLDKFKGPIATILIRNGTLKKGDQVLLNGVKGKIRGMFDWNGKALDSASPSTPVEILGLEAVPSVGATLGEEAGVKKAEEVRSLIDRLKSTDKKTLKVVVKADKQGSLEAIEDGLNKFNIEETKIEIVGSGTGDIGEGDIKLADSTKGIVLGFNVKVAPVATKIAETEKVLVRTYTIIYELLEEMEEVVEGLLAPGEVEENLGKAEVLAVFPHGTDKIAGSRVLEGYFSRGLKVRVFRGEDIIGESKVKTIRKVKDEVDRVDKGTECGMLFDPPIDISVGDTVESYRVI